MKLKINLILAGLGALTACGISGPLERAPPLWGEDRVVYEAEQAKQAEERKATEAARAARAMAKQAPPPSPVPSPAPAPKN